MNPPRDPDQTKPSVSTTRPERRGHARQRFRRGVQEMDAERNRRDDERGEVIRVVVIQVPEPPLAAAAEVEARDHDQ